MVRWSPSAVSNQVSATCPQGHYSEWVRSDVRQAALSSPDLTFVRGPRSPFSTDCAAGPASAAYWSYA